MPREFNIRRIQCRYPDREVVCDYCFQPLPHSHYYEIYEGENLPNPYPFHTANCAVRFIQRGRPFPSDSLINVCSDIDDPQEEATED